MLETLEGAVIYSTVSAGNLNLAIVHQKRVIHVIGKGKLHTRFYQIAFIYALFTLGI